MSTKSEVKCLDKTVDPLAETLALLDRYKGPQRDGVASLVAQARKLLAYDKGEEAAAKLLEAAELLGDEPCKAEEEGPVALLVSAPEEIAEAKERHAQNQIRQDAQIAKRKSNVVKACTGCAGFCCMAFATRFDKPQLWKWVWNDIRKMAQLTWQHAIRKRSADITREKRLAMRDCFCPTETVTAYWGEMGRGWRKLCDELLMLWMLTPVDMLEAGRRELCIRSDEHMWTCKAYDVCEGVCTIYNHRPVMCKSYECSDALKGRIPKIDGQYSNPELTHDSAWKLQENSKFRGFISTIAQYHARRERRSKQQYPSKPFPPAQQGGGGFL